MLKGNVIVGQSGGPTAVINASLVGVFKAAKDAGINKIYGMKNGIQGLLNESYVDLCEHIRNDLDIEILKRTPSSFLGSCRYKLPPIENNEQIYKQLFKILEKLNIKYFIYIGGNDSMDTIMKLSEYGLSIGSDIRFMGVPKTIDNDLAITDHTPGYGSAAKYVASTMKEVICDSTVYDMESVTIVEIMGRNAGWLTAASILSKGEDCCGPDLIYLPETSFDEKDFINRIDILIKEKKSVVIAVSEALKNSDGKFICEENLSYAAEDSFGHKILTGSALYLSELVGKELGIKARGIVLNTLQRCASHLVSRRDITEAFTAGAEAIRSAIAGKRGEMIIFKRVCNEPYQITTESYDIRKIANAEKIVPKEWIINDGTYISDDFITYSRPLIIGELEPFMVDGLPRHMSL